ncbi:3'(2'),5'-bisphosphate nucleotidase [Modestobacter sp. DSM 44400]|uniref:3'(2'),5'-bisphosphate nucleotidase CysQ n=1 Tax=Modestobacter sp. DSM 44400 TaxID=1550230 RepID=UPI0008982897|nr:3'(2'),5'-bisphosphate nucleotidase CysQ [Modestobacter sp. DSM 44400]SDY75444.1 3'(2'),5'-bisphosphate nucleotidase [Modestobacter sp. DSM 44400]
MTASDHDTARTLATSAGELLLQVRARDSADATARKTAGDAESHRFLMDALAAVRPDDAVLSEEGADDPARLGAERVWIVDPLDGTREFSELERADWAVHVALWERGELVAGAVALPAEGITLSTAEPREVPARSDGPLRLAVSRSRPPALVAVLSEQLGAELVPMGSAGVKAMAVVRGRADAYVHGGGQYEWDSAAPVAVARAAGLHTSRLDGSPLRYNQANPWLPDLLVCRPMFADQLLGALADTA